MPSCVYEHHGDKKSRWPVLSAPVGFADHQGRHLLGLGPSPAAVDAASAARIPANSERLGAESQPIFFQSAEHHKPLEDLRLAIANCRLKIVNQKSFDEELQPTSGGQKSYYLYIGNFTV